MKALYPTCSVTVGGTTYTVCLRVEHRRPAPRVGADSPRFLDPGKAPQARVLKILRDGVDVTEKLFYFTRRKIEAEALRMLKARACIGAGRTAFDVERNR